MVYCELIWFQNTNNNWFLQKPHNKVSFSNYEKWLSVIGDVKRSEVIRSEVKGLQ